MSAPPAAHRTRRDRWVVAAVAVGLLAAGCTDEPEAAPPVRVWVTHDGTTVHTTVDAGATVADALAKAKVEGHDGQLLAVESGDPIEPNGNPATYEIRGRSVDLDDQLTRRATIAVTDGADTTEPTVVTEQPIAVPPLPDAIQYVQFAGTPGVEEVTAGETSGEVVSRRTLTKAVGPHRANGKVLSLTFDDGPNPTYTPQILDILEDKGVTATFCQVGTSVDEHPELTQRIVDEGHQLCNHTMHHVEGLEDEPRETVEAEITDGRGAIEDAADVAPRFYRPPGGSLGPVIYEVAAEHEEAVLYWSIDPRDWKRPPPEEIAKTVINALGPGGIILLHDGGGNREATVAALPGIIDYARALGYTFTAPVSRRSEVG